MGRHGHGKLCGKDSRKGTATYLVCCIHPHVQSPAPHLALARSALEVMMTVPGKREGAAWLTALLLLL